MVIGSHTEIVKPKSKQADAYQFIHDRLQEVWVQQKSKTTRVRVSGNTVLQDFTSDIVIVEKQISVAQDLEPIQEGPVYETARQKADKMCSDGRPEEASQAFIDALEQERCDHRHRCETLLEG